ncbi:MAG: hypothetical protein WC471_05180 [Candidatus Woesearchaeota archaeon]
MFNIINIFILNHVEAFAQIISGMLLASIGLPLISFKGGIPRFAGIILNKKRAIFALLMGFILTFFIIVPLGELIVNIILQKYIEFTIPLLTITTGIFICIWDLEMKWKFHQYWIPWIIMGILLVIFEIWLY